MSGESADGQRFYAPWYTVDPTLSLVGSRIEHEWISSNSSCQRINFDLGVELYLDKIGMVNSHNDGGNTGIGIKNFDIQGSNDPLALAQTNPASDTYWTDVQTGLVATAYNASDPVQYYAVSFPSMAYRYYSLKISSNCGDATSNRVGIRDIEFWAWNPRFTFDYVFDNDVSETDAIEKICRSFNGTVIVSQEGKLKPVWEWKQEADGAGGLQDKTSKHSFDLDNIVRGSFKYCRPDRANKFTVKYIDPSEGFPRRPSRPRSSIELTKRA